MATPIPAAGPHCGRITSFDATRGLGRVVDDDGAEFDFHATAIVDGSRKIAVDTEVCFTVVPGRRGRYEARAVHAAPSQ